jgi:two-component system sensor histidine kinase KdpD
VVRAAARLAGQLNAEWHAVYVETPALQRLPAVRRERILGTLSLAKELGATTAVIADADVALSVVAYARDHNLSKLFIGDFLDGLVAGNTPAAEAGRRAGYRSR